MNNCESCFYEDTDKCDICKGLPKIAEHYGYQKQTIKCVEELRELEDVIKNLLKADKSDVETNVRLIHNFYEEIADVYNMLDHMTNIYHCKDKVEEIRVQKIQRELERIRSEVSDWQ